MRLKSLAQYSSIPIINAGDGGHQHPTQTFNRSINNQNIKGRLSNLTIGVCGDLKFGRTVHSLIKAMSRYSNVKFVLISPEELKVPNYIISEVLEKNNIEYMETNNYGRGYRRVGYTLYDQSSEERFFNEEDYIRLKDSYILDSDKMKS